MPNTRLNSVTTQGSEKKTSKEAKGKSDLPASPLLLLNDSAPCRNCTMIVCEGKSIQCDRCKSWFHLACSELNNADWENLRKTKSEAIWWNCSFCLKSGASPDDKLAAADAKLEAMMKIVETLQMQNQMILSLLQSTGGLVNQTVKEQINDFLGEEKEKNARKNNLIMFHIPESEKTGCEEKAADKRLVTDLYKMLIPGEDFAGEGALEVTRLGTKPALNSGRKPRAVKVTFADEGQKMSVLKKAKDVRRLPDGLASKVVIVPDKTLKEREKDKVLLTELKRRRLDGEDVIIRGGGGGYYKQT